MDVLSHPFRLGPTGAAATVLEGGGDANAEAIALLITTRKGERPLVPTFGMTDPAFDELDVAELNALLATFGPDVTVTDLTLERPNDRTEVALLTFDDL